MKKLNELLISRPPWKISVHCPYVVMDGLYAGKDEIIKSESTMVHDAPFTPEYKLRGKIMENDSRLISSAPDLYDACQRVIEWEDAVNQKKDPPERWGDILSAIRIAIAKASGENVEVKDVKPLNCFYCGSECACEDGYLECLNDNCCYSCGVRGQSDAITIAAHNNVANLVMREGGEK